MRTSVSSVVCAFFSTVILSAGVLGQAIGAYPHAATDRLIHQQTPMSPPRKNVVFVDPDFGSSMVRATDADTNFNQPGTFVQTEGSGEANEWNSDSKKFYVQGTNGQVFVFGFDPHTMHINSLPGTVQGRGFVVPLRPGPSFSFVDPDLIYGIDGRARFTIISYRFSTRVSTPIIDTRTCGVEPPLGTGPSVDSDSDVSLSLDDSRVSISEGGPEASKDMFVVVYDRHLGCRWYNTQTGQIGGRWGTTGSATVTTPYFIRHAYLSRDGRYVRILVNGFGWYIWQLSSLKVRPCAVGSDLQCGGYGIIGYHTHINGPAVLDDMQTVKRPLNNLSQITPLFYPLPSPGNWGQPQHFTWSNVDVHDSTPVCGSTYSYDGDTTIDQPYAGEIFCIETDGRASKVWRFAHNRAKWINPFFNTQPLGNVSRDGRFFLFNSDWDGQLGYARDGTPHSAVFIVNLN